MKKTLLAIIAIATISSGAIAQNVNIPDANFKAYLVGESGINTNGDSEIQVSEAVAFTGVINASSLGISDLTGIEAFLNVTSLLCDFNNLTSLDLSSNTALTNLICNNNSIASINLTGLTSLTNITAPTNNLTSIDISTNTALMAINVGVNNLTSFDISSNANLSIVYCFTNNLSSLNMANGNNTNIGSSFSATDNPGLTCIQVDDVAWSTSNWTNIDAGASFGTDCCTIDIPDANFKSYLIGNTSINTNGDGEIQCSEATSFTGIINCEGQNISELTGIEAFTALTGLYCGNNNLTSLDISNNSNLTQLYCGANDLSSLDVSNNTSLTYLRLDINNISSLDVSNNTALTYLRFNSNSINAIDLSNNLALTDLICYTNNLVSLELQNNVALTYLACAGNNLSVLNVANGNNSNVIGFSATTNPNLTCIQVDDVAYSTANWTTIDAGASFSLDCNYNVGLEEQNNASELSIYPNPTSGAITLKGLEGNADYQIRNVLGELVLHGTTSNGQAINVESLTNGVYYIQLEHSSNLKFVKQ